MKILEFKNRKEHFKEWLKEVEEVNFQDAEIKSALFMWELPPTKDGYCVTHCKYNCDLDQLKWFHRQLGERIKELEMDDFLRKHINDYIQYIE